MGLERGDSGICAKNACIFVIGWGASFLVTDEILTRKHAPREGFGGISGSTPGAPETGGGSASETGGGSASGGPETRSETWEWEWGWEGLKQGLKHGSGSGSGSV